MVRRTRGFKQRQDLRRVGVPRGGTPCALGRYGLTALRAASCGGREQPKHCRPEHGDSRARDLTKACRSMRLTRTVRTPAATWFSFTALRFIRLLRSLRELSLSSG